MSEQHPAITAVMRFYEYNHLPEPLRSIATQCSVLANNMIEDIEADPELTVGLRKLLEAKDCFVRAAVAQENRRTGRAKEGAPLPRPNRVV